MDSHTGFPYYACLRPRATKVYYGITHYQTNPTQTNPTLTDYLIVAQDAARVLLYERDGEGWRFAEIAGLGKSVFLPSVDATLALADVYALIELDVR